MNKLGLYVVDATLDNKEAIGSDKSSSVHYEVKRTALHLNGHKVAATDDESLSNRFGVYLGQNGLMCNGDVLLEGSNSPLNVVNGTVSFDDKVVASDNKCINITLDDYNKLRAGVDVSNYAPYSEGVVYYITDELSLATPVYYDPQLVEGHTDIIYNSFIDSSSGGIIDTVVIDDIVDGEVVRTRVTDDSEDPIDAKLLVTEKTITDPRNPPEIFVGHVDKFYKNSAVLNFEYYVDTVGYSSNCQDYDSTNDTYNGIGPTFTTIVENAYGEEIFRRTTYAGRFKVSIPLLRASGAAITGNTWFNIRTIDDAGRESITLFFKVSVAAPFVPNGNTPIGTYDTEGKYIMQKEDLDTWKISTFKFLEGYSSIETNPDYKTDPDKATADLRNNYFAGYRNKLALSALMADKKAKGYTGIVLYNENESPTSLDDHNNTCYPIDVHSIIDDKALTTSNYKEADPAQYPPTVFGGVTDYYLFKIRIEGDNYVLVNPFRYAGHTEDTDVQKPAGSTRYEPTSSYLNPCKLAPGKTVCVNGVEYTIPTNETPFEWIRRDGAHIARSLDDPRNINVVWDYDKKVWDSNNREVCKYAHKPYMHALRIKDLNSFLTLKSTPLYAWMKDGSRVINRFLADMQDGWGESATEGYYYFARRTYKPNKQPYHINIPDNFTIDCNYCTLIANYSSDEGNKKMTLIDFSGAVNSHMKNVKLVGACGGELCKDAYLNTNRLYGPNSFWEGGYVVNFTGATLCSLENSVVENSAGYELSFGPSYKMTELGSGYSTSYTPVAAFSGTTPNYVDFSGEFHSNSGVLLDDEGESLLPSTCYDYLNSSARYTGPITSDFINLSKSSIKLTATSLGGKSIVHTAEDGIIITSPSGFSTEDSRISKHPSVFVHFYDSNIRYIRSYRINTRGRIIPPLNASRMKITVYADFDSNGSIVDKNDNQELVIRPVVLEDQWSFNLWKPKVIAFAYTSDCLIKNGGVNIGKASLLCGPSINTTVMDWYFKGAASVSYAFSFNNCVHNNEDQCGMANNLSLINCTCYERDDSVYQRNPNVMTSYTGLSEGPTDRLTVINCKGFSINGQYTRYYFKDSWFNSATCGASHQYNTNHIGIIDGCTTNISSGTDSFVTDDGGGMHEVEYPKDSGNYIYEDRNVCRDPSIRNVFIKDSLLRARNSGETPYYGRNYVITKISTSKEVLVNIESLFAQQQMEVLTPINDGDTVDIIHPNYTYMEITTTEENQHTPTLLYNEKIGAYILDGEVMPSSYLGKDYLIVPTPGFHKIYYRQGEYGNGNNSKVHRGYGEGVLRPRQLTTQLQNPNQAGGITRLILLQNEPPVFGGSGSINSFGGGHCEILVPQEAKAAYLAHNLWKAAASRIKGVIYNIIED